MPHGVPNEGYPSCRARRCVWTHLIAYRLGCDPRFPFSLCLQLLIVGLPYLVLHRVQRGDRSFYLLGSGSWL